MRADRHRLLDEIDLITLGHMPGGAAHARALPVRDLDLTAVAADEWPRVVIAEVTRMVPGDTIVMVTPARPYAVLDALYVVTGDACMIEYLATGPHTWVTSLSRIS